jgi:putative heme-binding domain-containing protein
MTSAIRFGRFLGLAALVLVVSGSVNADQGRRGAEEDAADSPPKILTVCALPGSMPRTDKEPNGTPRGLDVAVAQRVGRVLGRTVEFHWCANAGCAWNCLPAGRCDMIVGLPRESGPARTVAWSVSYAAAQFGLVVPDGSGGIRSLADLHGKRVGIVAGTVALSEKDHQVARFKSREALIDGFKAGLLDAAFLDADFAAWYLHRNPGLNLKLVTEYVPHERWNMAVAVRPKDVQLLVEINRALAQLALTGEFLKIYAEYAVPFRPPFTGSIPQKASRNTWQRIHDRREVVVSMDPANLPYSGAKGEHPGFDVELAQALTQRLDVKLRIEWLDVQHETAVGQLLERQCDLVLGEAIAENTVADDEELAGKVLYSRPYYGTGYVLVERKDGPRVHSLTDLKGAKAQRLGTEAGSLADYSLRQRGYLRRLFRNQLASLKALNDGDIDYAYLWANVGWTLHVSPDFNLRVVPDYVPEDHWNIAVAMCRGDDELKQHVDAALDALIKDGTVSRIMSAYHVPYFAPFLERTGDTHGTADAAIQHRVADRGPEPRMQKIQTSKHGYSGIARVRSAGELVVGLDQNNLPFSSAHPEPAGLDYAIAGLLAQQLGVRLRVYWALSAHDSYPSKLSSKGLCDVILGVMPDDRFAQRVLYSRPYYEASYQLVVRSGHGPPMSQEPLAVEDGVAVRALGTRPVRSYPNTEAILDAVASGREKAGYVISTRGRWLAQTHWPGELSFLPPVQSHDRFPLCAAVRKSEGDLKDAIDGVWDELARSGELARVFARWHIPLNQANQQGAGGTVPAAGPAALEDAAATAEGQALFRGLCSGCHGGAGRGGKGPDLTDNRWIHGGSDQDIARVISNGVPNTTMKKLGDALKPDQIRKLIAYIHSLARSSADTTWKPYVGGDPRVGHKLFFDAQGKAQCVKCHSVAGEGGRIGPALDRIASRRAGEFIMESMLQPSKEIAPEYEAVAVATKDGRVITGLRVNETNFSIQIHEENGRFHSLLKRDLDEVKVLKKSLMPENLAEVLTVRDLHDLFAYLMTLE